jgi:hypothetical protein
MKTFILFFIVWSGALTAHAEVFPAFQLAHCETRGGSTLDITVSDLWDRSKDAVTTMDIKQGRITISLHGFASGTTGYSTSISEFDLRDRQLVKDVSLNLKSSASTEIKGEYGFSWSHGSILILSPNGRGTIVDNGDLLALYCDFKSPRNP